MTSQRHLEPGLAKHRPELAELSKKMLHPSCHPHPIRHCRPRLSNHPNTYNQQVARQRGLQSSFCQINRHSIYPYMPHCASYTLFKSKDRPTPSSKATRQHRPKRESAGAQKQPSHFPSEEKKGPRPTRSQCGTPPASSRQTSRPQPRLQDHSSVTAPGSHPRRPLIGPPLPSLPLK